MMNLRGLQPQRQPTGIASVVGGGSATVMGGSGAGGGNGSGALAAGGGLSRSSLGHSHANATGGKIVATSSSPDAEKFTDIIFMEETNPKVKILKNRKYVVFHLG